MLSEGRSLATEATPASTADSFRAQLAVSSDAYSAALSTERACILSEVFEKAPRRPWRVKKILVVHWIAPITRDITGVGAASKMALAQAQLRSWVRAKVTELEGFEDQVVIDSVCRRLEEVHLDRPAFESYLHILMEGRAAPFSAQLWRYLDGPTGAGPERDPRADAAAAAARAADAADGPPPNARGQVAVPTGDEAEDEYESYEEEEEEELPHLERADTTDEEGTAADGAAGVDSATGADGAGRGEAGVAKEAAEEAAAEPEILTDVLGVALRLPHRRR